MLRNAESHFATVPNLDMPRSAMSRSCGHQTTFNVGQCIPLYVDTDILPGDSVRMTTSKVLRLQTMLTPTFGNMFYDIYWFFVPHRLVWTHWKQFMRENTESAWIPQTEYELPSISSPLDANNDPTYFAPCTLADYLGWPTDAKWDNDAECRPHVLGIRAYALIMNEFFRSTVVTDPLNIPTGDSNQTGSNGSNYINDVANAGMPFVAAKTFDYFTSASPTPQRGPSVGFSFTPTLTVDGLAPVGSKNIGHDFSDFPLDLYSPARPASSTPEMYHAIYGGANAHVDGDHTGTDWWPDSDTSEITGNDSHPYMRPVNLWSDVSQVISLDGGVSFDINELRLAFQLQKFYERLAIGGDRYIETIKSMFSVTSPDARLQRPEYLGGNRVPIIVDEVTNTAQTNSDFLGDVGAKSVTSDIHQDFDHSFTEHGTLMCIGVCRYTHLYTGLERMWTRRKWTDFYWPLFQNLGSQPIWDCEIYPDDTTMATKSVFAYNEAWSEYRYKPDRVSGEMRPSHPQTLASWNLADNYQSCPTFSDGWIREDKTNVDRTLAVTSSVSNQIFADFFFDSVYTRVMPVYSLPGLIDHH